MAWKKTDDTYYGEIASAIRAKNSTNNTYQPSQMANAINAFPEFVDEEAALVLIDWEGTLLRSYTRDKVMALTALPYPSTLPNYAYADHDLLTFQEWNWDLADIKENLQNRPYGNLLVGAIYTTTDGQDHNYWGNPRLDTAITITMQKRGTTSIGTSAFQNCFSLTKINIPYGVTSIGNSAFQNCNSLTQINIPDGVTSIGNIAFQNCFSLTQINIPDGVTSIGNNAFQSCYSLTRINIPDGVTSIGSNAFQSCRSLTQINIPDGVTSIGNTAFEYCFSLCDILLESKPTLANTNAFSKLPTNYKNYVPRADLSWFETATNWSTIYTQGHIVAIEDYIEYLESIGFNVDDYKE